MTLQEEIVQGKYGTKHRVELILKVDTIVKELAEVLWMARRYADKRQTYAPNMFNDAYDNLRDMLGERIELKNGDVTIDNYPYATDGTFGVTSNRKYLNKDIESDKID